MTLTNDDLLAISNLMDDKLNSHLSPIGNRVTNIELTLENNVIPRLQNIESCYTSTYNWYRNDADKIESTCADVELLKKIVAEHSQKLQKIS